ncbi:4'-phosphopantetheinyl transferase [Streptomyces sp. NPDC020965]|uniref:4'-phosphopantetheinyl transferase n=1 Tax=Streptomyces sp. NPDC020965 TaxID=3365105 RepID=UPI003799F47C
MIERLLPSGAVSGEAFGDPPHLALYAEEAAAVRRAVVQRRREYATVRLCARRAMARLGVAPAPVLSGARGGPRWPTGLTGSMTHCAGYRAAVLARGDQYAMVGIDAEPHLPLPDGILEAIALPDEQRWVRRRCAATPQVHWDRLLFSCKESVYKAWFPHTGENLGFEHATIEAEGDGTGGTFSARLHFPDPAPARYGGGRPLLRGRWLVARGLVVSTIVMPE